MFVDTVLSTVAVITTIGAPILALARRLLSHGRLQRHQIPGIGEDIRAGGANKGVAGVADEICGMICGKNAAGSRTRSGRNQAEA